MELIPPGSWPKDAAGPATIGDLLAAGGGLNATCAVCLHTARLDLGDLAARHGAEHPCSEEALRPLLQCSVCKSSEAVLRTTGAARRAARRRRPAGVAASV